MRRALPYALLGIAALAAAWPILRVAGMPYNVDISGFFPLSPAAYEGRFWPLWNERGGMSTLQFLPALAFELPLLIAGRALGWGMDVHVKVRIVLGFAIAGMAMYALARHHLLKSRPWAPPAVLVLAPLAAGLLYMLNPWSVHRVFQWFLWLGYCLTPLVVLAFERLADAPSWRRALVLAAVTALATTDPHNPATFAVLLVPLALVRLVPLLRRDRRAAWALVRGVALAAGAWLAFAAYWLLPYAYNALHNPGFGPTYVMSREMLDTLSRNGGFLDALRLLHNYLPRGDLAPAGGLALAAWTVASFAIPLLAFAAVALDRSRVAWIHAAIATATVLLGMGSRGPLPGAYVWLLFDAPWGEGLSWLFRDPYRWGGIQALSCSVLLALSLAALRLRLGEARIPSAAPAAGMALVLVFAGPALASYTTGAYEPVVVPSEYAQANDHLAAAPVGAGVVWMPRMLGDTTWSGNRTLEYFDATSSGAPAMGPFRPATSAYFDFLQDAIQDGAPVAPLLARAGADRIVYHNDVDALDGARKIRQIESLGLVETGRYGGSPTLRVDQSSAGPTDAPAARYALHGERELAQSFVPNATSFAALLLRAEAIGSPGPLRVAVVDAAGREVFSRNATLRPGARDDAVPLDGLRLAPGATYALRLRAMGPSNQTNRYDVSYSKDDAYPAGSLDPVGGDLRFELLADARGFAVSLEGPAPAPRLRLASAAVASPGGLQILRAMEALPGNGSLREAPIVFLDQDAAARQAFARGEGSWTWAGGLNESRVAPVVSFLPAGVFRSAFGATTSADATKGWARATQDFTYYGWGWKRSLAALGLESREFDGGDGLVYTTTAADLTLDVHAPEEGVLLARVFGSPRGGPLSVQAEGPGIHANVGSIDTRAGAGFAWAEVGSVPAGTTTLRLQGDGDLQAVDLVALVPVKTYHAAQEAASARMASTPATLVAQAETVPGLAGRVVSVAGVGRVSEIAQPIEVALSVPAPGDYTLWLRAPADAAAPSVAIDGAARSTPACAASCADAAHWLAAPLGRLDVGAHTLRLGPAGAISQVDVLAVSSDPAFAGGLEPPVAWSRLSATEYRARVPHGGLLALAVPYDPGWVARAANGERIRSVPVDGVANGFVLPGGAGEITIVYEPQAWAEAGVGVSLVAALASLGLVGAAAWRRRASSPVPQEVFP